MELFSYKSSPAIEKISRKASPTVNSKTKKQIL